MDFTPEWNHYPDQEGTVEPMGRCVLQTKVQQVMEQLGHIKPEFRNLIEDLFHDSENTMLGVAERILSFLKRHPEKRHTTDFKRALTVAAFYLEPASHTCKCKKSKDELAMDYRVLPADLTRAMRVLTEGTTITSSSRVEDYMHRHTYHVLRAVGMHSYRLQYDIEHVGMQIWEKVQSSNRNRNSHSCLQSHQPMSFAACFLYMACKIFKIPKVSLKMVATLCGVAPGTLIHVENSIKEIFQ